MEVVGVVGQAALSASVESLLRILTSPDFLKFTRKNEVDKELKKWGSKLRKIRLVLDDAEAKQYDDEDVKHWLTDLRDLAYDTEDILDAFHTEALQSSLKSAESQASTSAMHRLLPSCCSALKPSGLRRNMNILSKLQEIAARFDDIVNEMKELELFSNAGVRYHRVARVPTTSLVEVPKIYGREKDKEAVLELLKHAETSDSPYSVISIIGMGGLGKTTLAQLVYNDKIVESFDRKAWVCVSDDFDILKITKAILQHWGSCEGENLNVLQESLKKKLQGKKFLIVLDDVWNENYELWTRLQSPFAAGAPGSKIIVTTRSTDVSALMGAVPGHALKELPDDDCLSLLAQHALNAGNFDTHPDLKVIGQEIILRCKGLPLAVKTLGGLLRGKQTIKEWEVILNSKMWDLPEAKSNLLPALRLSYHYLPSHLKQCFAFCAIFPKDYEFDDNELILLWMAQGFLQQPKDKKQLEEVGHEYFNDLLSRSFFQPSSANSARYVMHDLINDLAKFVCGGICFHLDDMSNRGEAHANIRHSSFTSSQCDTRQRFEVFKDMKNLRTFLVLPKFSNGCYLSSMVLDKLVPKLNCLRALSLAGYRLKKLPDFIGALKHLRFLNLSSNLITKLPQSLSELCHLQTLLLCNCHHLVELPIDIGNLRKLRHLDIRNTYVLRMMPLQITELSNLHSLSKFIVGEGSGLGVGDLMKLPHLQGRLQIEGLHSVANSQDAKLANLKEKQGLCELALQWRSRFDYSWDEANELQVLTSLRPHPFIEKLSISSYGGAVFPSWLSINPSFGKMVELKLENCHNIEVLSLGELSALAHLSIRGMHGVKEVAFKKFPALVTLVIKDMPGWEKWSHGNDEEFPKLSDLRLEGCPELVGELPCSLPSLIELNIYECQEAVLRNVADLPSLTTLHIREILGLASLDGTLVVQAMAALEDLNVDRCNELKYLWQDGTDLNNLANLKQLEIEYCGQLGSLVEGEEGLLPCNLQNLYIRYCENLEKLPSGLHSLASLGNLKISGCSKLVSFAEGAGLSCNLKRLQIGGCTDLESLPVGMMVAMVGDNRNQSLLEELEITDCQSLKSFPQGKLPTTLKSLRIERCEKLESLPEGIMTYNNCGRDQRDMSRLEHLHIHDIGSSWLTSFPTGHQFPAYLKHITISYLNTLPTGQQYFPTSLEELEIYDSKIESLSSLHIHTLFHLAKLTIAGFNELESFPQGGFPLPNLIKLCVRNCGKLKHLTNSMDNLNSLQLLEIGTCKSLVSLTTSGLPPNLSMLTIYDCKNLAQPMSDWRLNALTSLTYLRMSITPNKESFPEDDSDGSPLLPTSLKYLWILHQDNLRSISKGIQHLTSLERLEIFHCPKAQFLPKEGLPATLGYLRIVGCPLLRERCKKENGDYWPILAHIPLVVLYD